jgi:DNA processing protein
LADQIAGRGLILSEHPPGTPPLAFHFPMRNRLISGLCAGVVVIEASERSGSLITAGCALDQGREVMAVPGNVLSGRNRGGHALIRDGGTIVESVDDVVEQLGWHHLTTRSGAVGGELPAPDQNDPLLRIMSPGDVYDLDRLAASAAADTAHVLARLLALELQGLVQRAADGRFMRSLRTC